MRNWIKALIAGSLSVVSAQQLALFVLNAQNVPVVPVFALRATAVFGAPLIVVQAISGALWAPLLWALIRRAEAAGYYVGATLIGAALPSLAALLLCSLLVGDASAVFIAQTVQTALVLGAAWGFGVALWMHLLRLLP